VILPQLETVQLGLFGRALQTSPTPADAERNAVFREVSEAPDQIFKVVGDHLQGDNAPNFQDILMAIENLVDSSSGQRPAPVLVELPVGAELVNQLAEQFRTQLVQKLGFGKPLKTN